MSQAIQILGQQANQNTSNGQKIKIKLDNVTACLKMRDPTECASQAGNQWIWEPIFEKYTFYLTQKQAILVTQHKNVTEMRGYVHKEQKNWL